MSALERESPTSALLDRLEDYGATAGLPRVLAASLAAQVSRRLATDEFNVAQACLERLQALDAAAPERDPHIFDGLHFAARSAAIRFHIATGDLEQAALELDETIAYCDAHRREGYIARLRLQRAVIDMRMGRAPSARANVEAALSAGHRLGLMRSLLDADASVLDLIGELAREAPFDAVLTFYVERLQAAQPRPAEDAAPKTGATTRRRAAGEGIKTLSEREVEVVRLLGEALSTKKIARTLGLSPETVKWHLTNIYAKLGVSGRDEAVERMRDME